MPATTKTPARVAPSGRVASAWHRAPGRCAGAARRTALLLALVVMLLGSCGTYVRRVDLAEEYFNIGNAFYDLEAYENATEYYQKALALDPELVRANFNLARAYIETGVYEDAIVILEELQDDDPENALVLETLAYAYSKRERYDEALELYEEVLGASPFRVSALYSAGVLHRRLDNTERARELLEKAWELTPDDGDVLYDYGLVLHESGEVEQAVAVLSEYVDQAPEEETARLLRVASIYSDERYYARAIEVYDGILDGEPGNEQALFEKAVLNLTVTEEPDAGVEMLRSALEAGFSDTDRISEFLEREDLLSKTRVEAVFNEYELLPEEGAEEEEAAEEEGGEEGPDEEAEGPDEEGASGEPETSGNDDAGSATGVVE